MSDSWRTCLRRITCGCLPSPPKEPSLMRMPATSPRSMSVSMPRKCFTGEKNVKRRLRQRRDDEMPVGLVALRIRLDLTVVAQVLVHEPAFARGHRVERHRPPVPQRVLRRLIGLAPEHDLAALPVALGVDDDP